MARTGLRRGEALGLRRSDVHLLTDSRELGCEVARAHLHVVRRDDNPNGAVAKSRRRRAVPLDFLVVQAFDSYEFERMTVPAAASGEFVFVNLFRAPLSAPMRLDAVNDLVTAAVLLGHLSAEMSLRYGRLFDATVREEYQRALTLAKAHLGPAIPGDRTQLPLAAITGGNWRDAPLIKARLCGGYCLRAAAQGPCPYTNICERCPNFRSEASFLPILQLQRTDTETPHHRSSAVGSLDFPRLLLGPRTAAGGQGGADDEKRAPDTQQRS